MTAATFVSYLDEHAGAFTALLTLALVLVTFYYAVQNRRMVAEMRRARSASVLPRLGLEFHRLSPTAVTLAIRNVGPGAALDLNVVVKFEPLNYEHAAPEFRWRRNILSPGEQADFMQPGDLSDSMNTLPSRYRSIRLTGSMMDAVGTGHDVEEVFDDLPGWRELLSGARQRYTEPDPERRLAEALHPRFKDPIADVSGGLRDIAQAVAVLHPPKRPDE